VGQLTRRKSARRIKRRIRRSLRFHMLKTICRATISINLLDSLRFLPVKMTLKMNLNKILRL